MDYRKDIDGLRAIAVLSVLIFHVNPALMPGGFVGVDVFFVISGFLITGILVRSLDAGQFSLTHFYAQRARRILPALFVTVALTLAFGWFILLPGDYADLGRSALYSAAFLPNLYFLFNTGYFDASADMMPLLHLWSLGVEEQFYLIWPLLLFGAALAGRNVRRTAGLMGVALFAASFAAAIWTVRSAPETAFYMPHLRAWEFLSGAALVFIPKLWNARVPRMAADVAAGIGVALILFACYWLHEDSSFPGITALPPVLGATLIIWAGAVGQGTVARLLSVAPMRFFGRISYSLYLWHWPVVVYFRHYANEEPATALQQIFLLALSVLLGWLSYRFVEQPFRTMEMPDSRRIIAGTAALLAMAGLGGAVYAYDGAPARLPQQALSMASSNALWAWKCPQTVRIEALGPEGQCVVGADWATAEFKGIAWGDSHVLHYLPFLDIAAKKAGVALVAWYACPAFVDDDKVKEAKVDDPRYSRECRDKQRQARDWITKSGDVRFVALAAFWSQKPATIYAHNVEDRDRRTGLKLMESSMRELIETLDPTKRRILLLGDFPSFPKSPVPCVLAQESGLLRAGCPEERTQMTQATYESRSAVTNAVLAKLANGRRHIAFVRAGEGLCASPECVTALNGEYLYRDGNHIRRNLSEKTTNDIVALIGLDAAFAHVLRREVPGTVKASAAD